MNKCYVVMWDNGDNYEDHEQGVWCICKTKEYADKMVQELNAKIDKDGSKIKALRHEGKYKEADKINDQYREKIYYFQLKELSFFVSEEDYYDE